MQDSKRLFDRNALRAISVMAGGCDPRTVLKWLRDPASVRPILARAIAAAYQQLGPAPEAER